MSQYDINLRDYWRILKKRKAVIIITAIILGLFSTSIAILRAPTPIYTSVCSIKFEKETTVEGLYAKTISWSHSDDIETQISVIKGFSVFERVAQEVGLIPKKGVKDSHLKSDVISLISNLQKKVRVTREKYTTILHIEVEDRNPVLTQKLANAIARVYKAQHSEQQTKRTRDAIKYIGDQLQSVRQSLKDAEDDLNRFSQENQLISIELQGENILVRSQETQNNIRKTGEEKRELEDLYRRLAQFVKEPSGSGHNFYSTKVGSQYLSLNSNLVGLLLKKDTLLEDFTVQHPSVVALERKITEDARKMLILLEQQIKDLEKRGVGLRNELEGIGRNTDILMEKKIEFNRLKRQVEMYTNMTELLEEKNQEALIRQAEKPEEITVVKPALLPTVPINPPKTTATGALGVLIGLIVGLVSALIVETFDTSLGAIEDVEQGIGFPVLGVIPYMDTKQIQETLKKKAMDSSVKTSLMTEASYLITHFAPKSMIAESFRALRTNLQFKDTDKRIKTIAITSTSPQEGKSFLSLNLAIAMAQSGIKTLLVGCDMRKPVLAKALGVENVPGLSDVLLGNYCWRDTVKTITDLIMGKMGLEAVMITSGLDNLCTITGGTIPPNPAELIESRRLTDFIEEAKEAYDLIIFDLPPILSTADAVIVSSKMDGVLLAYRVGSVSKGLLKRSASQLVQVKSDVVGVILNGMKPEISPDFQDYKYYKYYHAYGDENEGRKGHLSGWGHSLLRRKGGSLEKTRKSAPNGHVGKWAEKGGSKGGRVMKLFLFVVGLVFLTSGILWHNGMIDPSELPFFQSLFQKKESKLLVKKNRPEKNIATSIDKRPTSTPPSMVHGAIVEETTHLEEKAITTHRTGTKTPTPIDKDKLDMNPATARVDFSEEIIIAVPQPKRDATKDRPSIERDRGRKKAVPETKGPMMNPPMVHRYPKDDANMALPERRLLPAKNPNTIFPWTIPSESKKMVERPGSKSRTEISPYPYSLYLGSFKAPRLVKKVVSFYRRKGLSPYWSKVEFKKKGVWFRVFTGYFRDSEEAEKFRAVHDLREAEVKRTAYANLIGVYSDGYELADTITKLKSLGYSPYIIPGQTESCRLFLGAYITREGAEQYSEDLRGSGIEVRVVTR